MKSRIRLQPLVNFDDNSNFGYEALYQRKNGRGSYPSAIQILKTILEEEKGNKNNDARLFINLTQHDLKNKNFADNLIRIIDKYSLSYETIVLEVSEDTPSTVFDKAIPMLCTLQQCGVKIALDDFGLSYSLVNFAKDFYFDFIKIDQAFVQQSSDHAIGVMKHLIDLSKESGCTVIAEGIETDSQLTFATEIGATIGQGFFLATRRQESTFIQLTEFPDYLKANIVAA